MITDSQLAAAMFAWSRTVFGMAASDVYVWRVVGNGYKRLRVAITGDPLRLELAMNRTYRNRSGWFDTSIATALGTPTKRVGEYPGYPSPRYFEDDDDVAFVSIVEGIEGALRDAIDADATDTQVDFTVIPSPGEPYADKPTEYLSARRGKLTSKTPPWIVTVEVRDPDTSRDIKRPGANFCQLAPMPKTPRSPYEAIAFDSQHTMIVTHSVDIIAHAADAKVLKACGGMLFPSLAVGTIPASNFGPLTLVADPAIILAGIKPYRARGAWPVTVYSTDVWTPVTREIVGSASAEMYDQLTGNWNITVYTRPHLWMLGPQVQLEGGRMGGRVLSTVSSLRAAIRKRTKDWSHVRTLADLEQMKARYGGLNTGEAWYYFLEAKSHTILPMEWYPAAFIPAAFKTQAQKWLTAAGFTGKLHALKTSDAIVETYKADRRTHDDDDLRRLTWARQIGEAARTMLSAKVVKASAVDHWWP